MIKNKKIHQLRCLFLATRVFPYSAFLITLFPVFAILIQQGIVTTLLDLLWILPFIFAMAAGFTYNTVCDAKTDPKNKNPITRGELSEKIAVYATSAYIITAIVLFTILCQKWIAVGMFLIYLFLWLAYDGFKIRFKESVFAPAVASFVLWVGPPLILSLAFEVETNELIFLLLGIFAVYFGHEIKHTVIEYDVDKGFGLKTFAIITGKKLATIIEYISLFIGFVFLLVSINYLSVGYEYATIFFIALFTLSLIATIAYGRKNDYAPRQDRIFVILPYISTKIFIIAFSIMESNMSPLWIFFSIWLFLLRYYP